MENEMDALLAILLLKPLLEYFWVFNNPMKIPQWTLPSHLRTQRVLFTFPVPTTHFLDALLVEYLLHRMFSSSVLLCAPFAPTQCPPGRASQNPQ
jgi:hypothetical protein